MSTTFAATAEASGPVWLDLAIPFGTVTVTVDPDLTNAVVAVRTTADEGPVAEAVCHSSYSEKLVSGRYCMTVTVTGARQASPREEATLLTEVRVPGSASSLRLETSRAALVVFGDLHVLDFSSRSGGLTTSGGVQSLKAATTDGNVIVGRVSSHADISTSSGDITIGTSSPKELHIRTETGNVRVSAEGVTPADR
ncbi:DUF4097 family beta strand repeat-containing protein [Streptomyces anulatus]|uniref:DUF4097 family beta strand repeat-containing protein n=1 Tax=Streptomyces anulatus TaxID=1892 RepID=UPI002E131FE6|nr:DUF4097 family beta strand repeat-containing protein [Streptomyces anulatus]